MLNHIFCVFFFVEGTFRERLPSLMAAIGSKIMALFSHFIFKFSGNGPQCHPHVFHRSVRVGNYAVAWADAGGLRVPSRFRLLVFSLQTHGMLVQVAEEPGGCGGCDRSPATFFLAPCTLANSCHLCCGSLVPHRPCDQHRVCAHPLPQCTSSCAIAQVVSLGF